MSVPDDQAIRMMRMPQLIDLRQALLTLSNNPITQLTAYDAILKDTLALAALVRAKAAHEATLPPEPDWAREIVEAEPPRTKPGARLDDLIIEKRIRDLIRVGLSDAEIWRELTETFEIIDAYDEETENAVVQAETNTD